MIQGDVECVVTPNGTIYLQQAIANIKEALTIDIAAAPEASYGFPHGAASASKVGGNDLTAGETAP